MKSFLITFLLFLLLLTVTAGETCTYTFGTESNPEKAEVTEKDGCYHVVCVIKDSGNNNRNQDALNRLKAQKICLLGIASYRKGKKLSRCSATVRGLSLLKESKKSGEELVFVYTVPVDGVIEKNIQTVK